MSMLEVKDLEVYYGVIQAIKGISFHVEEGEVIALIGANSLKERSLQRFRDIRSYLWEWHTFRKEDVYLHSCPC